MNHQYMWMSHSFACDCIQLLLNTICLVKICSKEVSFNVKSIGAEGEVVSMSKFEKIQQLTQQLYLHGGPKDVNDSSLSFDKDSE